MPINKSELTKEMLEIAMQCKNVEELIAQAKAGGYELTKEEAEAYLAELADVELDETALNKVVAGNCYMVGDCKDKERNDTKNDLSEIILNEIGFLDREPLTTGFDGYYKDFEDNIKVKNKHKTVINYYGYGGIGKSTLMGRIKEKLKTNHCLVIHYPLGESASIATYIFSMKQLLVSECGFEFPFMDLAQYVYECINGNNPVFPKAKPSIEKSESMRICFGLFGELPLIGPAFSLVKAWDDVYAIMKDENNKTLITQLQNSGAMDLENGLRDLFIQELNDNMNKVKKPLVVIFDMFENLACKSDGIINLQDNDQWICGPGGLIERVPNVLWVIAGREELKWKGWNEKSLRSLITCPVGPLEEDYQDIFLKRGKIPVEFHIALKRLTKGIPAFLRLCVELARVRNANDLTMDDFGTTKDGMIKRLFRHLTPTQRDLLFLLSCLDSWTDKMAEEVCPKVLGQIVDSNYKRVKQLSFIKYDEANKRYCMDNVIKELVFLKAASESPALITKTLEFATEYLMKHKDPDNIKAMMVLALKDLKSDEEDDALKDDNSDNAGDKKLLDDDKLLEFYKEYFKDYLFDRSRLGLIAEVNTIFYNFYERAKKSENKKLQIYAYYSFSFFLLNAGRYKDAYEAGKQALELCKEELKEKKSLRLEVESNYSECLRRVGEVNQALKLAKKVWDKRREKSGERKRDTLDSKNDYAMLLSEAGYDEEAYKLGDEVYRTQTAKFGEDDPDTLRYMSNMAVYLCGMGKYEEAINWGKKAYIKQKTNAKLGENHPDTLLSMANIASILATTGRLEEALEWARKVVDKRTIVLGKYHPDTIRSMIQLSRYLSMYCDFDKDKEAVYWDRIVVYRRIRSLGKNNKDTLWSMAALSTDLARINDYKKAIRWSRRVLNGRKEVLGEEHLDTIQAMLNLSIHLFLNDEDDEESKKLADEAFEKVKALIAEQKAEPGAVDPVIRRLVRDLAIIFTNRGDYGEALELKKELLDIHNVGLGKTSLENIQDITSYYQDLFEAGELEEALKLEKDLLSKLKKDLGEDYPDVLHRMRELSSHYFSARKYKESVKLDEELLAIRERISGKDDPATLQAMMDLAYSLDVLAQTETFEESVMKTLAGRKELLKEDLPDTFQSMRKLAEDFCNLDRYVDAEALDSRVLDRLKELLGEDHPEVLQSKEDLAYDLSGSGKYWKAVELEKEIVDRKKALLGEKGLSWEKDEDTLRVMRNLAYDLSALGEHDKAYLLDKIVYEKRKELLGENHPDTLDSMKDMTVDLSNLLQ